MFFFLYFPEFAISRILAYAGYNNLKIHMLV